MQYACVCSEDLFLAPVRLAQKERKVTEETVVQMVDPGFQDCEVMMDLLEDLDYPDHLVR